MRELNELGIVYKKNGTRFCFSYADIDMEYCEETGHVYVDKNHYMKIPHIMPDGSVCISGNDMIHVNESVSSEKLKRTVTEYIPWLFNISPELKVIEFLAEIDFFIRKMGNSCEIKQLKKPRKSIKISTPFDIWECINLMKPGQSSNFIVEEESLNYSVMVKKIKDKDFVVDYNEHELACKRIVGNDFKRKDNVIGVIGVGSVNSYIIKKLVAYGHNSFVLVDNDKVEVGNLLRYAFPYLHQNKVQATKKFIKEVCRNSKVEAINTRINLKSKNFFLNCDRIYISVDNFMSWIDVRNYLCQKELYNSEIIFVGIDAFGSFGKFVKVDSRWSHAHLNNKFAEFMRFTDEKVSRKEMIPNGCGKSLAIYGEEELLKLAGKVITHEEFDKVIKVGFDKN